jgi:hypothetical protein
MTKTYFYPETAECAVDLGYPSGSPNTAPFAPLYPDNTMGGFSEGADIHDYNGDRGAANIFLPMNPSDPIPTANLKDTLAPFFPWGSLVSAGPPPQIHPTSWYLMRRTVFKNWTIAGIFTRPTDFLLEIDFESLYANGGFRDEAQNTALGGSWWWQTGDRSRQASPYGEGGAPQGAGFAVKVMVGSTVKGSLIVAGSLDPFSTSLNSRARGIVAIALPGLTPTDLASLEVHLISEQFCNAAKIADTLTYPHPKVETALYRLGLAADPVAMRSSGKMSAALTSR